MARAFPSCSYVVFLVHMVVCLHHAKITNQFKIFFEKVKPVVFSVMETKQLVDLTFIHFQSVVLYHEEIAFVFSFYEVFFLLPSLSPPFLKT